MWHWHVTHVCLNIFIKFWALNHIASVYKKESQKLGHKLWKISCYFPTGPQLWKEVKCESGIDGFFEDVFWVGGIFVGFLISSLRFNSNFWCTKPFLFIISMGLRLLWTKSLYSFVVVRDELITDLSLVSCEIDLALMIAHMLIIIMKLWTCRE